MFLSWRLIFFSYLKVSKMHHCKISLRGFNYKDYCNVIRGLNLL